VTRRKRRPRRFKELRSYDVAEIADALDVHRNTVRHWIAKGLKPIDGRRPALVLGTELKRFLEARRGLRKCKCPPGTIYCMRCREARRPAGTIAELRELTPTTGNLIGICPACDALMYRRVSLASLAAVSADLDVTVTKAESRIEDS